VDTPYPAPPPADVVEDHHGEQVADPYRRLEDPDAPETVAFVAAQNERSERFLAAVPEREALRARLAELWDHEQADTPFERGGRWFQLRSTGLANQPVLYVMDSPAGGGAPLLDPNALSPDGTVAVTSVEVSEDGTKLLYGTSVAGSDWRTLRVRDVASGVDDADVVEWTKWGTTPWLHDGSGFLYSALPAPSAGAELQEQNRFPRVMLHRLGTPQAEDELLFEAPDEPEWLFDERISDDGRFVLVRIQRGTNPESQLRVLDLERRGDGFVPLVTDFRARVEVVANEGRTFFLLTDEGAGRQRIVAADLDARDRDRWRDVVPEAPETLDGAWWCGGRLVCHYLEHGASLLRVHELDGTHVRDVRLPGFAGLGHRATERPVVEGRPQSDLVHFKWSSFARAGEIWSHDVRTGETRAVRRDTVPSDADDYETARHFVSADDGTQIPLFVTWRRGTQPSGDVPTLLYGYGGFNVAITPELYIPHLAWVEHGGLLAVACLRGGGEYGKAWHDAGRLARKQRVFDDFCACARFLAESGWSRPERIAIAGGSNGGLLVGACLTQHPELFGAAVAEVGVFDLLRFHLFTIGWAWTSDFGDPRDPEQYRWLRAYSPLHNVVPGRAYPPTLLLTGDHDDRVVPGHSLKFAATLQAGQAGEGPVLLRVEPSAGHGQGKPVAKRIAEQADVLAFLVATVGRTRHEPVDRPARPHD
jgi:prolyl oligopeptidase